MATTAELLQRLNTASPQAEEEEEDETLLQRLNRLSPQPDFPGAGIIEPLQTIISGAAGQAAGGLAGLAVGAGELLGLAEPGAGARVSQEVSEALTILPETEAGQQGLQSLGEGVQFIVDKFNIPASGIAGIVELVSGQGLDQAVKTIESTQERGLGVTAGERVLEETGSPLLATAARIAPEAALEVAGFRGAGQAVRAGAEPAGRALAEVSRAVEPLTEAGQALFKVQSPTKQRIARLIEGGSTDFETAGFQLSPDSPKRLEFRPPSKLPARLQKALNVGGPRVIKDTDALETIRQGFDEGVIAAVKGSSEADKVKMVEMVRIMQRGKKNKLFAQTNRPSDVAGDSLLDRFRIVRSTNRKAGKELDDVANSLKGKKVNFDEAISQFNSDLDSMGVTLTQTPSGLKPNFAGSIIEDLQGPEAAIKRIVSRLGKPGEIDAFELHRMKKFIDEQVTFGKSAEGLSGRTESVLKNLRRNLDQALDSNFSQYDRVNSTFAETIGAIDALQDVAGKKLNLTGKNADAAVGTLLRRLMSNAQSRVPLLDAIEELEIVAKKFSKTTGKELVPFGSKNIVINDDLLTQVLFADELDSVFGPVARTSFQGQIDQPLRRAARGGLREAAIEVAAETAERFRGINEDEAFRSIRRLLKR